MIKPLAPSETKNITDNRKIFSVVNFYCRTVKRHRAVSVHDAIVNMCINYYH